MELLQLEYFLEVANSLHMTKSAEKLYISQPTLSQAISRLEKELGVELFIRKGRNIAITEQGKFLRDRLLPLKEHFDQVFEELKTMAESGTETLHLNVFASSVIVSEAIVEYCKSRKNINFKLYQNENNDLCDITVTTRAFSKSEDTASDKFICSEKIFLAVPNNEKYKNRKNIRLEELKNENFISLAGSKQFRSICDRYLSVAGITPKTVFESDNPDTVRNMIAANLGVGFYPEFTWGKQSSEHVRLLEITEPVCRRDILITAHDRHSEKTAAKEFYAFLTNYFKEKFST